MSEVYWNEDAIRIRARRAEWRPGVEILIMRGNDTILMSDGTFLKIEKNNPIPYRAGATLDLNEAQRLMDELYAAGLRPSEAAGSAGAMYAVQKHLEDMRTIAFLAIRQEPKESK